MISTSIGKCAREEEGKEEHGSERGGGGGNETELALFFFPSIKARKQEAISERTSRRGEPGDPELAEKEAEAEAIEGLRLHPSRKMTKKDNKVDNCRSLGRHDISFYRS